MADSTRLTRLLKSRRSCIAINTFEEDYTVSLVREIAIELPRPLYMRSASGGMQEGYLEIIVTLTHFEVTSVAMSPITRDEPGGSSPLIREFHYA